MSDTNTTVTTTQPIASERTRFASMPAWERVLERLRPDNKGWMTIAASVVMFFILEMIRENPGLLANASFMQFAGMLATGGFLLSCSHFLGGSKSGSDVMIAQSKAITGTGAGTTTTTTTDPKTAATVETTTTGKPQ